MLAASHLYHLYEAWKRLTQEETAAILKLNWTEVRRCQEEKHELQLQIIQSTDAARSECASPAEVEAVNLKIREMVNELIQLEWQNNELLQKRLEQVEGEIGQMDRTATRLRRVHGSYAPPQPSNWHQYS